MKYLTMVIHIDFQLLRGKGGKGFIYDLRSQNILKSSRNLSS